MLFQDDDFVEVSSKTTGVKQMIPRVWLEDPEGIGKDFELTPSGREAAQLAAGPSLDWTLKKLEEHADSIGVDHTGLRSKVDVLEAIQAAVPPPPDSPNAGAVVGSGEAPTDPDTPANGEGQE
jgi:hypothetical protein